MDKDDIEVYMCYSITLRDYLYQHGMRYKVAAVNPNSNKMFWLYIKTDKLKQLLTSYSNEKPIER